MACHVFTYEISDCINFCHITFLQCGQSKPLSSSLTNLENSTSSFRHSVQICCREEQKEENNGNCKTFSLHANAIILLCIDRDVALKSEKN